MILKRFTAGKYCLILFKFVHCRYKGVRRLFVKKQTGDAFLYGIRRAALPVGDDRAARRLSFYGDNAEILNTGKEQGLCGSEKLEDFRIGNPA
jgi:hypothetical protein